MRINNPRYKKRPINRDYSRKPKCAEQECPKYIYQGGPYCMTHRDALKDVELTAEQQDELAKAVHKASLNDLQLLSILMTDVPGIQRPERLLRLVQDTGYAPEEQEE